MAIDPFTITAGVALVTILLAYLTGMVSLLRYNRDRRPSSLLQAISFFLLVVPSLNVLLVYYGYLSLYDWAAYTLAFVLAYTLLVLSYLWEIRRQSIRLHVVQIILVALSFALPLSYSVFQYLSVPFDLFQYFGFGPLFQMLMLYLSLGMVVAVLTLMYSFSKARENQMMLVGMAGFILILLEVAVNAVRALVRYNDSIQDLDLFLLILGVLGYGVNLWVAIMLYRSRSTISVKS